MLNYILITIILILVAVIYEVYRQMISCNNILNNVNNIHIEFNNIDKLVINKLFVLDDNNNILIDQSYKTDNEVYSYLKSIGSAEATFNVKNIIFNLSVKGIPSKIFIEGEYSGKMIIKKNQQQFFSNNIMITKDRPFITTIH
jgi:hypothetical protein